MTTSSQPDLSHIDAYDYPLPESLIAKYPLAERDASRMLVIDRQKKTLHDHTFRELPQFLNNGDLLIRNNAKVMPARLIGHREGFEGSVELFLLNPKNTERSVWDVLMRPARKLKAGTNVLFPGTPLTATIVEQLELGHGVVSLHWPSEQALDDVLAIAGQLPLPPYLNRQNEAADEERYQTVYAKVTGAQAAPTAGLHFTPQTFDALREKGIQTDEVTLWVSSGTFRPVVSEHINAHTMDAERYEMSADTAQRITETRRQGHRVMAVGTTSCKTLESVAHKHHGQLQPDADHSQLFITPGFHFQATDMLLTNFHLPKSTLLMLVSAFIGDHELTMAAYHHATSEQYRFYSYGDCMLIL